MPIVVIVVGVLVVVGALALTILSTNEAEVKTAEEAEQVENEMVQPDDSDETTQTPPSVDSSTDTTVETSTESDSTYADGTYAFASTYRVPSGHEEAIRVSLQLENDIITGATVDFDGDIGTSRLYQAKFTDAYQQVVVGTSLDQVSLSRVGGASLTSEAFNKAVAEVKLQAS